MVGGGVVLRAICKVLFLLMSALLLPRFLLLYAPQQQIISARLSGEDSKTQLGVEQYTDFLRQAKLDLSGKKILLVTNQMPDKWSHKYLQFLADHGVVPHVICRMHYNAITTKLGDGAQPDTFKRAVQIIDTFAAKDVKRADVVLVDLQNSGFAVDDAIKDLVYVMQQCLRYKKQLIILDRPNPLGYLLEGPLVQVLDTKTKFLLPLRYAMSIGEVANYANKQLLKNDLTMLVVPLQHHLRNGLVEFDQMQKVYTAGLFEMLKGTIPAEIKSDCRSNFQCLALPEYLNFSVDKWYKLRAALWHSNVEVSLCRYFNRKTEQYFEGVRLAIDDINRVSYLKVWQTFFRFMSSANIKIRPTLLFNNVFGETRAVEFMTGNPSLASIEFWNDELKRFYQEVKPCLIYRPWPMKVLL